MTSDPSDSLDLSVTRAKSHVRVALDLLELGESLICLEQNLSSTSGSCAVSRSYGSRAVRPELYPGQACDDEGCS